MLHEVGRHQVDLLLQSDELKKCLATSKFDRIVYRFRCCFFLGSRHFFLRWPQKISLSAAGNAEIDLEAPTHADEKIMESPRKQNEGLRLANNRINEEISTEIS